VREWTALHAFPSLAFWDVLVRAQPASSDSKQALFIPPVIAASRNLTLHCIPTFQLDGLLP
jgi:hypothetical protein